QQPACIGRTNAHGRLCWTGQRTKHPGSQQRQRQQEHHKARSDGLAVPERLPERAVRNIQLTDIVRGGAGELNRRVCSSKLPQVQ
ncbi:hypothetical protein EV177_010660, partial [Coemansia sp. RSA 1804]